MTRANLYLVFVGGTESKEWHVISYHTSFLCEFPRNYVEFQTSATDGTVTVVIQNSNTFKVQGTSLLQD